MSYMIERELRELDKEIKEIRRNMDILRWRLNDLEERRKEYDGNPE